MTEIITSQYNDHMYKEIKLVQTEECDNSINHAIIHINVCSNTIHVNYIF